MIKLLLSTSLLLLSILSTLSYAQDFREPAVFSQPALNLTWTLPTLNTDGQAVTVDHMIVGYGIVGSPAPVTEVATPGPDESYVLTGIPEGTYAMRVLPVDTDGLESAWSGEVVATITGARFRPEATQDLAATEESGLTSLHNAIDECADVGTDNCIASVNFNWSGAVNQNIGS